jgi:hypothetical protein
MKKLFALVVAVVALAWAVPASADQLNAGCQAYGAAVAFAVQSNVPGGQVVSGIAHTGPGAVAGFAEGFKSGTCG